MLHYRHINQGERWKVMPMARAGTVHEATIPADYTGTNDHLQIYVTATTSDGVGVLPGFPDDLAGPPYATISQR